MKFVKKEFDEKYSKKWNIYMNDYVQLADDDGNLISDSVYRLGGFFSWNNFNKGEYFDLLKYTEEYFGDNITKDKKQKRHLEGRPCIVDKNGVEKVVAEACDSIYIRNNSVIYSRDKGLYNIETGEYYGKPSTEINGEKYIIIENRWEKDENLKGVFMIDKKTGKKQLIDTIK